MIDIKNQIIEAKKKIGNEASYIIIQDLNIEKYDERNKKGICPFHKRENGEPEHTPSFAWSEKDYAFKCFSCGKRYGLLDHYMAQGNSFRKSAEMLFDLVSMDYDFTPTIKKDYRMPHEEFSSGLEGVYSYLETRKIKKETAIRAGIRRDKFGNMAFEYRDENDNLLLVKYRPSHKLKQGENKSWTQKDADTTPLLWGMDRCNFDEPLIIQEGEIDSLAVLQAGFLNAVSVPFGAGNYHWIEHNWDWLNNFDSIILCADNDKAGEKMKTEVVPRLGEWRCKVVSFPPPVEVNGELRTLKDMNEVLFFLGEQTIRDMIENAKDVPIQDVVNMADVEDIDLSIAIGMKSGVKDLDKRLGKFYLGCLAVWTGINGSGKSSIINQICVVEPLQQGFKTFIFSGELSKQQLKTWIELPLAGRNNIDVINKGDDQPLFFKVKQEPRQKMAKWYDKKVYFYDNDIDKSAKSLLDKMETMARRHGVKNFVIDNLMTVDLDEYKGENDFNKQKQFVKELVSFAIRYNVMIHLIAHPRKQDFVKRLNKFDVSGTGDITNLAHYVLAIHRVSAQEKAGVKNKAGEYITEPIDCDTIIDVFKNRLVGEQDYAIMQYFDVKSKRIYSDDISLYKEYGWETMVEKEKVMQMIEGVNYDDEDCKW